MQNTLVPKGPPQCDLDHLRTNGSKHALTVLALRNDGFTHQITLGLKAPLAGFTLGGGRISAGQERVRVTLTVPPVPTSAPTAIEFVGHAEIGDDGESPVVPADDMMPAFAYRHLVPA